MRLQDIGAAFRRRSRLARRRHFERFAALGSGVELARGLSIKAPVEAGRVVSVGDRSHLDGRLVVQGDGQILIGRHCSFRSGTYIGSSARIKIGDRVFGAEDIFITDNNNHPTAIADRREMAITPPNSPLWKWTNPLVVASPVSLGDDVWLGRGCVILKGVTIGSGSIVGASAVVTKDVPPGSLVVGNPARVVRQLD